METKERKTDSSVVTKGNVQIQGSNGKAFDESLLNDCDDRSKNLSINNRKCPPEIQERRAVWNPTPSPVSGIIMFQIHVLPMCWEATDLCTLAERAELGDILDVQYDSKVKQLRPNSNCLYQQFKAILGELAKELNPQDWLIVQYGGHDRLDTLSTPTLQVIAATTLYWEVIQNDVHNLEVSLFLLVDFRDTSTAVLGAYECDGPQRLEITAAVRALEFAENTGPAAGSFTSGLRRRVPSGSSHLLLFGINLLYNKILSSVKEDCNTRPHKYGGERGSCYILSIPLYISLGSKAYSADPSETLNEPFSGPSIAFNRQELSPRLQIKGSPANQELQSNLVSANNSPDASQRKAH
ncbi:hypothetical protein BGZ60DRAFT_432782 [Tricladium varicosporioides]|nr:hypothetical protein BGZ60DRAFT_432782 [Hymenoscyphus varicosporioides]